MIQSITFWLVLFGSVAVFWQLPKQFRYGFIALVSYAYLLTLAPVTVTLLIAWVLLFFYVAPHSVAATGRKGWVLSGLVGAALSYLIYAKYLPGIIDTFREGVQDHKILVPLGISYFSFKLIHYAVEVSRGNIKERSLSKFFAYIFLFPIFTAGPIERYDHFLENLETNWQRSTMVEGIMRIAYGLIKILVIAKFFQYEIYGLNNPTIFGVIHETPTLHVWCFVILSYLTAYLDFSAYSDIAIGASRLFGIRIMENFRFPILARNISDFWNRWHMTLARWCQSYVYMPVIAYTRNPYAAVYATFLAMGLWHGATAPWIMWGLYHATGVAVFTTLSRYRRKLGVDHAIYRYSRPIGVPLTFLFVSGSYAFSTSESGWTSILILLKLLGISAEF